MSALINISKKLNLHNGKNSGLWARTETLTEGFWFTLSLLLFVILGPFSAIPAFLAVMSLGNKEDMNEPEAI